MIKRITHNLQR